MKIRCSCGTKFELNVTPEMAENPPSFVCPSCGLDSSEYINQLVREELAEQGIIKSSAPQPPAAAPRLKIAHSENPVAALAPAMATPPSKYCQKHRGVRVTEKCVVCDTPICPQCMELFGYFCSPLCKNKADLQGIAAPVYARQKFEVERKFWRKTGLIFGSFVAAVILFFGVWIWYAWFGSVPHPYFSVRFEDNDRAYAGAAQLVGQDQIVFLHGGTLARYDLKTKKQIWSQELIAQNQIDAIVKMENDTRARASESDEMPHIPPAGSQERLAKIMLQSALTLHVNGQDVWVNQFGKLVHYDWDSGKVLQEILPEAGGTGTNSAAQNSVAGNSATGGLPLAGGDNGRPLDPNKVTEQAQNMTLPARIALPALLANETHEQQLEAALRDDPQHPRPQNSTAPKVGAESFRFIPGENGLVQFSVKLLEARLVTRDAMQAAPKISALDGDLSAGKTAEAANETLNEMQRNRGGGTVTEDESRYQVTVHLPGSPGVADWTGEVVGPPQLFALKSVNVIAAGKSVIVLDPSNKKLWQAALTYNVSTDEGGFAGRESKFGAGPCVEHDGTLFVFDQAVLSAFDLTTGNARWRLPSIGVVGLFFDDQNNLYVNTTTGNPDDIKYSRQIDITKATDDVLLKIDSKSGKTLWSIKPGGFISYLSGKFIYTVQTYDPNPTDEEQLSDMGITKPAFFRIARISPKNGRVMWEYYDKLDRCPVDVRFQDNTIELIFKREVQVLKYLAF